MSFLALVYFLNGFELGLLTGAALVALGVIRSAKAEAALKDSIRRASEEIHRRN